jgi:multiple sugar transport system substrate-binding protein
VRDGLIKAMTDYTYVYGKGCTPPSSTAWKDPDNNVAFHNKTIILTHNATISIAAKWLDDMNNASLTEAQRATAKKNYTELIATAGFPNKPDGTKMTYRSAVKTGVIFKDAKNKAGAKAFVAFILDEPILGPYVEGSLGRWFPVTKAGQQSPFWKNDPHRLAVYNQFMAGTTSVRVHQELQVHHAEQRERLGQGHEPHPQREGAGGQGGGRDDRAHQGRRQLILCRACRSRQAKGSH